MIDTSFWKGKKVLVTGHTGFKGTWLCLWLQHLGAKVAGYSLKPPTKPSLFELCEINIPTIYADIRDKDQLNEYIQNIKPEIVIHMAAQPLVRLSYKDPVTTYETNVLGTIYLLDALRKITEGEESVKAIINVTSDKCYENKEWEWGYREHDRLGGHDPYSTSKACSELITASYRQSYFPSTQYEKHGVALASARAGNVIGGGDWAEDRLIPSCIKALLKKEKIIIRNPYSIRPWQHVLEPLSGYLLLAQKLVTHGIEYAGEWNFGPNEIDNQAVLSVAEDFCNKWKGNTDFIVKSLDNLHEAQQLRLDCTKAKLRLGWYPRWDTKQAIDKLVEWTKAYEQNRNIKDVCIGQIKDYHSSPLNIN